MDMKERFKDVTSKAVDVASDTAKKAADAASETAKKAQAVLSDTAKNAAEAFDAGQKKVRTAYYKPVFPEEYAAPDYDRPKMIVIEDEDDRKGIDVCEGSIGWFEKAADLEILHLYEEAVPMSGVEFFPPPTCGAIYFENKVTPGRYINLERYFDVLEKDKITELRKIAYELGAKSCRLESYEESKSARIAKAGVGSKFKGLIAREEGSKETDPVSGSETAKVEIGNTEGFKKSIVFSQTFEGSAEPRRPKLEWFKNDREIEFLIDSRCNDEGLNKTKKYSIQLDSSLTQSMSVATAAKIDRALGKLGSVWNFSIEGEAKGEARKQFVFEIEF